MLTFSLLALAGYALYAYLEEPKKTPKKVPKRELSAGTEQGALVAASSTSPSAKPNAALVREEDAILDKHLVASCSALGVAAAGALFFPPISVLSVPLILYSALPLLKQAYHSIVHEQRLRSSVIDTAALTGALLVRQYVVTSLFGTIFLLTLKLINKTERHTRSQLTNIFGEQPNTVWVLKDGVELEVPFQQLAPGDVVVVQAGQVVPADGIIRAGSATIDQHALTGESQPIDKQAGDWVFALTLTVAGRIEVVVEKAGSATVAAKIGEILEHIGDYRDEIQSRGERLADQSAYPLIALSVLGGLARGTEGAVAILNSRYTTGIRLAVPLSMLNFLTRATASGILIKDGRALELVSAVDTVVFDKTGTLTLAEPHLGSIHPCNGITEAALLTYAAAAEAKQSHPIARAILNAAAERSLPLPSAEGTQYQVGYGIQAQIDGCQIRVGSARFLEREGITIPASFQQLQAQAYERGYSLIYVVTDDRLAGALELRPTVRPEAQEVVSALRAAGLTLCIVSGDHEGPTRHLAAELGIERYFAEKLPEEKTRLVEQMQKEGRKVCFVGDGINDSAALKMANASVSLSGATSIAVDTAQVVMMDGSLRQLPELFKLSKEFDANTKVSWLATLGPSAFSIAGVFFFRFSIATVFMLGNLSMLVSFANAMLPAIKGKEGRREEDQTVNV